MYSITEGLLASKAVPVSLQLHGSCHCNLTNCRQGGGTALQPDSTASSLSRYVIEVRRCAEASVLTSSLLSLSVP